MRWWNLAERRESVGAKNPNDYADWFRSTFDDAVRLRRISDVPVGVLLSGGLDSTSIAASTAVGGGRRTATFTVRFPEAAYDEGPLARQVAAQWDLDYHELNAESDDPLSSLADCSRLLDEPLAHGNDSHVLAISRYAKPRVTVLLSGEGADETLGGYVRYQPLRHPHLLRTGQVAMRFAGPLVRNSGRLSKLARYFESAAADRLPMFNSCDVFPQELTAIGLSPEIDSAYRDAVLAEARAAYPREPVRQAMYYDQHTFLSSLLDRNDRMTMGASIECRVPFLDYRLVEGLAAAPSSVLFDFRRGKALLRRAVGDRLPRAVVQARKWGFGVPWARDLRRNPALRQAVESLSRRSPIADGPLDSVALQKVIADFLNGDDRPMMLVRQLLMVVVWFETCVLPSRHVAAASRN